LENRVIPSYDDRHFGCRRIICRRDIQTIDVESASTEHAGNSCQNAELVFHQDRYRVTHKGIGIIRAKRSKSIKILRPCAFLATSCAPFEPVQVFLASSYDSIYSARETIRRIYIRLRRHL